MNLAAQGQYGFGIKSGDIPVGGLDHVAIATENHTVLGYRVKTLVVGQVLIFEAHHNGYRAILPLESVEAELAVHGPQVGHTDVI